MNILLPIPRDNRSDWPIVCCAWCGDDLNVNGNLGLWDVRNHFAECQLFLSSEAGMRWAATKEGIKWMQREAQGE